ncbi:MAG TPA: hypothetical protein VGR43_00840 [Dehalococcoidia bacterium]|jgi:hypothetical protein|nr:hypothetical protein [Dehalococcoidia bacterium]
MDYSADSPLPQAKGACPVCGSRPEGAALFCAACGAFLKTDDGRRPHKRVTKPAAPNGHPAAAIAAPVDGLDQGFIGLLGEITQLQRDLLRQFRQGQALQARQFERALQAQALQLDKTLAHAANQVQASEQRLQIWQRWTAGLAAAAVVFLLVVASQVI